MELNTIFEYQLNCNDEQNTKDSLLFYFVDKFKDDVTAPEFELSLHSFPKDELYLKDFSNLEYISSKKTKIPHFKEI